MAAITIIIITVDVEHLLVAMITEKEEERTVARHGELELPVLCCIYLCIVYIFIRCVFTLYYILYSSSSSPRKRLT